MDFVPFVKEDFEVFQIDGLEARMDELKNGCAQNLKRWDSILHLLCLL